MMTNDFENRLDAIRIELNEKTKSMSKQEIVDSVNANGRRIAEKYGITVVKSVSSGPAPRVRALD